MILSLRHRSLSSLDHWLGAAVVAVLLCAGCSGRSVTADNPVVGLVPPRIAVAEGDVETARSQDADESVKQVAFADGGDAASLDADMAEIAAVVNGTPILVSDVVEQYSLQIAQAKRELPAVKYAKLRDQLIRRELPRLIDEAVLMDAALSQLGADQRDQLEQQLDTFFSEKLIDIQKQMKVGTLAELEAKMQAQGTTLSNLRRAFGRQQLAAQSMQLHMTADPVVTRPQLLAEYEQRIDEYKQPAQVQWQQIWVSYAKHGGKKKALAVVDAAIAELKNGTDFASVARKYSDGVMAKEGGQWDWTQKGSLSNEEVERMLFELNLGEIGQVVAGKKAFHLVRVTKRRPDRVTPFAEVQSDLREEILSKKRQENTKEVVKKLKKAAVITTMFDAS